MHCLSCICWESMTTSHTCSSLSTFSFRPFRRLFWAFLAVSGGVSSALTDNGLTSPSASHTSSISPHAQQLKRYRAVHLL